MSEGLDNIDSIFKDAFDGFEANVDPSVWTNVQNTIGSGTSGASDVSPKIDPTSVAAGSMKAVITKIAVGVAVVGSIATAGYMIVNNEGAEENVISENITIDDRGVVADNQEEVNTTLSNDEAETSQENTNSSENLISAEETTNAVEENTPSEESSKISQKSTDASTQEESNDASGERVGSTEEESNTSSTTQEQAPEVTKQEEAKEEEIKEEETSQELPEKTEAPESQIAQVDIIPNVITPNGDGENDIIKITGKDLAKVEVVIMDKTGKPVYRITSIDDHWNGKDMNGYDLIPGVYYLAGVVVDDNGKLKNIKQTVNLFK